MGSRVVTAVLPGCRLTTCRMAAPPSLACPSSLPPLRYGSQRVMPARTAATAIAAPSSTASFARRNPKPLSCSALQSSPKQCDEPCGNALLCGNPGLRVFCTCSSATFACLPPAVRSQWTCDVMPCFLPGWTRVACKQAPSGAPAYTGYELPRPGRGLLLTKPEAF